MEDFYFPTPTSEIFDYEFEMDAVALTINLRTLVVPLGQRCPHLLQDFIEHEEEYKESLRQRFKQILKDYNSNDAVSAIKKIISIWWKTIYNFK